MSGVKKQGAATERFVARLCTAALLHPRDPTVLLVQELIKINGLRAVVQHYSYMLEWLPK